MPTPDNRLLPYSFYEFRIPQEELEWDDVADTILSTLERSYRLADYVARQYNKSVKEYRTSI